MNGVRAVRLLVVTVVDNLGLGRAGGAQILALSGVIPVAQDPWTSQ